MFRPLLVLLIQFEDHIIQTILRRPGFHRFVGRIQRYVDEKQNGRHPDQPLHPGEATELPSTPESSFFRHFVSELKNQAKGNPTKDDPPHR
ncbi:hypothetical protein SAPIO_CDS10191 [Scedosporium apiospermum]|uniref:Uncharacterized protein n=1 Tax=Pseudallescheria apiosperma TaxID=563466 RepID=A0A084FUW7_PSEDA|nr:uncharacterized protein SAPIO_CDS10191 [Scedosporium apiospermum]KEZ38879.1 hypothetical protein SAPIO_CDS10191 [Scedosporium apiospermum]